MSDAELDSPASSSSLLSPPDSQTLTPQPTRQHSNANGKRPLLEDPEPVPSATTNINLTSRAQPASTNDHDPKPRPDFPPRTHQASGYTWSRTEDEPGYGWTNKKSQDEFARAWEGVVHRDAMVRERYGDVFEMVEKERAVIAASGSGAAR